MNIWDLKKKKNDFVASHRCKLQHNGIHDILLPPGFSYPVHLISYFLVFTESIIRVNVHGRQRHCSSYPINNNFSSYFENHGTNFCQDFWNAAFALESQANCCEYCKWRDKGTKFEIFFDEELKIFENAGAAEKLSACRSSHRVDDQEHYITQLIANISSCIGGSVNCEWASLKDGKGSWESGRLRCSERVRRDKSVQRTGQSSLMKLGMASVRSTMPSQMVIVDGWGGSVDSGAYSRGAFTIVIPCLAQREDQLYDRRCSTSKQFLVVLGLNRTICRLLPPGKTFNISYAL